MLTEYDHAAKLRQSCENMKKCRDAAMAVKKQRLAREQFDMESSNDLPASTPSDPLTNLQR